MAKKPNIPKLARKRDVGGLIDALSYHDEYVDRMWIVRRDAADKLHECGDDRAIEPLRAALNGAVGEIRRHWTDLKKRRTVNLAQAVLAWPFSVWPERVDAELRGSRWVQGQPEIYWGLVRIEWPRAAAIIQAMTLMKLSKDESSAQPLLEALSAMGGPQAVEARTYLLRGPA